MDFVDEKPVGFKVNGKSFEYKPVTAGEENSWIMEYLKLTDDGYVQDFGKLNELKLKRNLKSVPYTKSEIQNAIGVEKDWSEMSEDERWRLLQKLKPVVFSEIVNKVGVIDNPKKKDN